MAKRTVYFAKITRAPQRKLWDADFHTDIQNALNPDLTVSRYGRTWRFSQPMYIDNAYLAGKLGFTPEGEEERTVYDEARHDYVTALAPATQSSYSHFVIDTTEEVLAFEERGRVIRRTSFLNAFRGLLGVAEFDADVDLLTDPASLREWARSADRIVTLRAVVQDPNPGFVADVGIVRDVIVDSHAKSAEIKVTAAEDDSLNVEAPWIQGSLHQISEEGQGTMAAVGVRSGMETRWTTGQRVRTASMVQERTDDSQTIWAALIDKLRSRE